MKLVIITITILLLANVNAATNWTAVQSFLHQAIQNGIFPGVAIGVASSTQVLYTKAFGNYEYKRDIFSPNVTLDTKWDLDRLTQIPITAAMMHLYDNGKYNLSDKVSKYQFDFNNNGKQNITIQNIMLHNSGFQPQYPGNLPKTPQQVLRHVNAAKLNYTVGSKFLYSSQGLVVVAELIQKLSNKTLQNYVYQVNVQNGVRNTNYVLGTGQIYKMAPTAYVAARGGLLKGRPLDAMADLFGAKGSGNAGMYSTVGDILRLMRILVSGGQIPKQTKCYQKTTVDLFTTKVKTTYNSTRAYIFDTLPADDNPVTGTKFSANSFGLYGLTGSIAWADKDKNVTIVVLSNSAYANGVDKFRSISGQLLDIIMTILGY